VETEVGFGINAMAPVRTVKERCRSHFFRLRSAPVSNFSIQIRIRKFFKSANPTPVQTPVTIDPAEINPCFYLRNDQPDSCYSWNWKV